MLLALALWSLAMAGEPWTEEATVARVLAVDPGLLALGARLEVVEAAAVSESWLRAPELRLGLDELGTSARPRATAQVRLRFEHPAEILEQDALAHQALVRAAGELEHRAQAIAAQTRALHRLVVLAEESVALHERSLALATGSMGSTEARLAAGLGTELEGLAAADALERALRELEHHELEADSLRSALRAALGLAPDEPLLLAGTDTPGPHGLPDRASLTARVLAPTLGESSPPAGPGRVAWLPWPTYLQAEASRRPAIPHTATPPSLEFGVSVGLELPHPRAARHGVRADPARRLADQALQAEDQARLAAELDEAWRVAQAAEVRWHRARARRDEAVARHRARGPVEEPQLATRYAARLLALEGTELADRKAWVLAVARLEALVGAL